MSEHFIGVMTGNSMDAADAVLWDFAYDVGVVRSARAPIPAALRAQLQALAHAETVNVRELLAAQNELTDVCVDAVAKLRLTSRDYYVGAIGCHGQTIAHRPADGATWQLLNGARLAEKTGLNVVCDFRSRDIASGGQGAPLAPFFHAAFFAGKAPCEIINIGGIANITRLNRYGEIAHAYDTGPGMLLMDAWAQKTGAGAYDEDGALAKQGKVDLALLQRLLAHPYFAQPAPKSCGREEFSLALLGDVAALPPEDVQATLLEFTARTIADAVQEKKVYLCGGGSCNAALVARLAELLPAALRSTADAGLDPQLVEAAAFAYLAKCHMDGRTLEANAVTGGKTRIAGARYPGESWLSQWKPPSAIRRAPPARTIRGRAAR